VGGAGVPAPVSVTRLILPGAQIGLGEVRVPSEAAHHARVARVQAGSGIELLDLDGTVGTGQLIAWEGRDCVVRIDAVERERGEPPAPLVLALAVLHTDAFSWAIEKATELGATAVVPVLTERVQGRRHGKRRERWQRVADAAVAQCGRSRPPQVVEPRELHDVVTAATGVRLVAHFAADTLPVPGVGASGMTILVGPEGGLDEREVAAVLGAGFVPLRLGPRTLRAETAAVAALVVAQQAAGWL